MQKKITLITASVIVLLLIATVFSLIYMENRYDIIENVEDVKIKAEYLYSQGDLEAAITNLNTYCQYAVTDFEAKTLLGDWYMESGESSKAYECYVQAAYNKMPEKGEIAPLTIKNIEEVILVSAEEYGLEISPDVRLTKDMTVTVTGYNLAPENYNSGRVYEYDHTLIEEERYKTTEWFDVNPEGAFLTLSGGFNCAIWQFMGESGEIVAYARSENTYRHKERYSVNIYQMARVIIPENARKCRVTYYDLQLDNVTSSPEEKLTIVYGRLPGESKASNTVTYNIPDLKDGEKIVYRSGIWKKVSPEGEVILSEWAIPSLERGSLVRIGGTVPGKVIFDNSDFTTFDKNSIYTIRFDKNNPTNTGERLDSAKNLSFNGGVADGFLSEGENDFDNIYPWSEIKLCTIQDGNIIYKGEAGFSLTGEAGDVFVEIPKFYVKRTVDENYDTISISGYCHEGFSVDEAFITKEGEADKIYIGAYINSLDNSGNMKSVSNSSPVLYMSPMEAISKIEAKGQGYKAFDYAALSAVQKLFMVETGVRNSQTLYLGICGFSIASAAESGKSYSTALKTNSKTNCIEVDGTYPYNEDDSVVLYNVFNFEESYLNAMNDIRKVTAVVNNEDGSVSVFFTGEPVDITQDETAIAHIAKKNGDANSVGYHTGAMATSRGTLAFKYRYMENIWGNAHVYVDAVSIKNGVATLTDRKGNKYTLSYSLPTETYSKNADTMIKTLGYDENYPGVMLPEVIGDSATSSTYYGDTYLHAGQDDNEYTLHYGGAWNSAEAAGLFSYAAVTDKDEGSMNASSRMMYIK